MIDVHSHILPGLDDGPGDLQGSLELGRTYAEAGYNKVVATPHWVIGSSWAPAPDLIRSRAAELNAALRGAGIRLEVLSGMEIALAAELPSLLSEGKLLTLENSSYVLVELPFHALPFGWDRILFALQARNFRVILAHPERCSQLMSHPELCADLDSAGVALQVNWGSLAGFYGPEVRDTACELALRGQVRLVATDSHDHRSRGLKGLKEARLKLEGLVGEERMRVLAEENPARVVAGEELAAVEPVTAGRLRRRWKAGKRRN